jgi:hypothetical protein
MVKGVSPTVEAKSEGLCEYDIANGNDQGAGSESSR